VTDDAIPSSHDMEPHGEEGSGISELLVPVLAGVALATAYAMQREWIGAPRELQLALFMVAYLIAGLEAFVRGLKLALRAHLDVDFLMVVAAVGAAFIGKWVDGGLLLFLFALGNALEHYAMGQARKAIRALGKLAPKTARLLRGTQEQEVPVEQLQVDDVVIVRPGERLPADGRVRAGSGAVDQSPITGESVPVEKSPGDDVFAGTVNGDGSLEVSVTKRSADSTMSRMIRLVEEAQHQKGRTQRTAEAFTRIYVPCVVAGTVAAIVVPPWLGWLPFDQALLRAIAMLVGASPCALAISTCTLLTLARVVTDWRLRYLWLAASVAGLLAVLDSDVRGAYGLVLVWPALAFYLFKVKPIATVAYPRLKTSLLMLAALLLVVALIPSPFIQKPLQRMQICRVAYIQEYAHI
jgi:cation transport ATPase